jgi:hypothetical protein
MLSQHYWVLLYFILYLFLNLYFVNLEFEMSPETLHAGIYIKLYILTIYTLKDGMKLKEW